MRRIQTIFPVLLLAGITACGGGGGGDGGPNGGGDGGGDISNLTLALSPVASGLEGPIHLTAPAGDARLFVVERAGRIRILSRSGVPQEQPFLDISDRVAAPEGERGLTSLAFDPGYATNGRFYVFYAATNGDGAVERFTVSAGNSNLADAASGVRILTIPHAGNAFHYGGMLQFGPDGMLYVSTGEAQNGPLAQSLDTLLGKLLRIDVTDTGGAAYIAPADNPFAGQTGARPEIWAYGLRNPWRFSFDSANGRMYLSDVGEGSREEVNVLASGEAGLNFGWDVMEGSLCYSPDMSVTECVREGKRLPTLEYAHDNGACAIIGGFVYRGSAIPELQGRYFYSDLCAGWLRSFSYSNGAATEQRQWDVASLSQIYSFGQDASGELYALTGTGDVMRLIRQP